MPKYILELNADIDSKNIPINLYKLKHIIRKALADANCDIIGGIIKLAECDKPPIKLSWLESEKEGEN